MSEIDRDHGRPEIYYLPEDGAPREEDEEWDEGLDHDEEDRDDDWEDRDDDWVPPLGVWEEDDLD